MIAIWIDGVCECGSPIIEMAGEEKDYMNSCTNQMCKHFHWHHVYDDEEAGYYIHEVGATIHD